MFTKEEKLQWLNQKPCHDCPEANKDISFRCGTCYDVDKWLEKKTEGILIIA